MDGATGSTVLVGDVKLDDMDIALVVASVRKLIEEWTSHRHRPDSRSELQRYPQITSPTLGHGTQRLVSLPSTGV